MIMNGDEHYCARREMSSARLAAVDHVTLDGEVIFRERKRDSWLRKSKAQNEPLKNAVRRKSRQGGSIFYVAPINLRDAVFGLPPALCRFAGL